jgi:hypothetical protein
MSVVMYLNFLSDKIIENPSTNIDLGSPDTFLSEMEQLSDASPVHFSDLFVNKNRINQTFVKSNVPLIYI